MPPTLINRAHEILKQLETLHEKENVGEQVKQLSAQKVQLSIFDSHTETFEEMRKILESTDINRLTPVEALLKLNEIKGMLK